MWHPRIAALGLSFWLGASLIITDALAQDVPGYRIRMPVGGSFGPPVRPPRLAGTPPSTLHPFGKDRRARSFFPYYWPFGYYDGSDGDRYADDSTGQAYTTDTQRVPVQAARDVYPVYDTVPPLGPLRVSSVLVGTKPMVRLAWHDNGHGATQVAFFLADSTRSVLSAETVRAPPFTTVLEPTSRTAFAGMTVMLRGGTLETVYVPYRWRAE